MALDEYSSNSPFIAHVILLLNTYIRLGGYFKKNCFLFCPSKNVSFKNIATLFPSSTISNAC